MENKNNFQNVIDLDKGSDRIVAYVVSDPEKTFVQLNDLAEKERISKLFIYLKEHFVTYINENNYQIEGTMTGFFNEENAVLVSKFFSTERRQSDSEQLNNEVMTIVNSDTKCLENLVEADGFTVELLKEKDIDRLTELYKRVFAKYPTNIYDPNYIKKVMDANEYVFVVAKHKDKVVAAASAMLTPYGSAEITDCATDPDFRGNQLLAIIINQLESVLHSRGINMFYSITRAVSVGMNMTVKRLGYKYEGMLIKNCVISSGFEDMNVWTKNVN